MNTILPPGIRAAQRRLACIATAMLLAADVAAGAQPSVAAPRVDPETERRMLSLLDAPLLFVKRHSYTGIHIYDTYYKWPPGGGGIYVLENPAAPRQQWRIRAVVDPTTPNSPGEGVYTHPELSWDAKRLLFCFKGKPDGSTSIYEVGMDGTGLRRLTDPSPACAGYRGSFAGQHDIAPAYLPDGRIVFLSTRPSGLVPCFNTGVAILHVMNADGSDIHPISVNNVNEFDPAVLPDGRILFGRWEYVDKTALTIQSLWTVFPDGTNETALFANNMVFPEAILDARPVPGSHLIVGTLAPHNAPPRGTIAFIDPHVGKNDPAAIFNLEYPDRPTFDRGDSCEPWPLNADTVIFSGRPPGSKRNAIQMIDRAGRRITVLADPDICLHSPMLVKPRPVPPVLPTAARRDQKTGYFYVQDIYQGLRGVKRGEVKRLRVIEETSRISPTPGGQQPYNQTFLVSAALAFSAKNYLGVVDVEEDGSAFFEAPAGRALYFQALDGEGRLVQSMRTFVQAAPGATRSCIGCHEHKFSTPASGSSVKRALSGPPQQLRDESWGSGLMDYPSMVQPVLDRHCASCHGGAADMAAGLDLTGGWTEHFSISYENLVNRRETQLTAYWIAGIDCMNGTSLWSARIFEPRTHGSGAAPLAQLLVEGHGGRIPHLTRAERDLLMAWMDSNGLYHGSWDYTRHGCAIKEWSTIRQSVMTQMRAAGCMSCHDQSRFENDWINLKDPQYSRILRAPLAKGADGWGLGLCRQRKASSDRRVKLLWNGYAHAVQPVESFPVRPATRPAADDAAPYVAFTGTADPAYQAMLAVIWDARQRALAQPRQDMPGAEVIAGACRQFIEPDLPQEAPLLRAEVGEGPTVELWWRRTARSVGVEVEVHRGDRPDFAPAAGTLLARTAAGRYVDTAPPAGRVWYAAMFVMRDARGSVSRVEVTVPPAAPPPAPRDLRAKGVHGAVRLWWLAPPGGAAGYHVYRGAPGGPMEKITERPVVGTSWIDAGAKPLVQYAYAVSAVSRRGLEGSACAPSAPAAALDRRNPVFRLDLSGGVRGLLDDGSAVAATVHGGAVAADGALDLRRGGHVTFARREEFDLLQPLSVECRVWLDEAGRMPVVVSCGVWNSAGWFIQRLGNVWRWHVGGIDCDGGNPVVGRWVHLAGTFDGRTARLFVDGVKVAEKSGSAALAPWKGAMHVGQYSGRPGPEYQLSGRVADVKIYHRALDAAEVAAAAGRQAK